MNLINQGANDGTYSFAWHGGDLSYADDWYSGVLPCESDWPVCYNGTSSYLPPGDFPPDYKIPLPVGEVASQGSPNGGDMSVIYESNWDLWQQWMNPITQTIRTFPYTIRKSTLLIPPSLHDRSRKPRSLLHGVRRWQQHHDSLHERRHRQWLSTHITADLLQLPSVAEVHTSQLSPPLYRILIHKKGTSLPTNSASRTRATQTSAAETCGIHLITA